MRLRSTDLSGLESPLDHAPITQQHLRVVLICAAGWFWDVVELVLGSVLASVFFVKTSPISPGPLSWLLASTYVGAIFGAPTFGWFADRYGRRHAILIALTILAMSSCAAALTPTVWWLIVCRIISGLAIGAYPVIVVSYFSELMPVRARGKMLLIAAGIGSVAWPATLFGARLLAASTMGAETWRWICAGGGVGSALTAVGALWLHESPRWLRSRQQCASAECAERAFLSAAPLFAGPASAIVPSRTVSSPTSTSFRATVRARNVRLRPLAFLLALLNGLNPWSTVGFPLLSGAVLVSRGFPLTDTFLFTGIAACGCVVGLFAAAWRIDSVERRTVLMFCTVSMAACEILFVIADSRLWVILTGVLFTTASGTYIHMFNIYVAEMLPTRVRALGVSSGWAINRLTSVMVPLVLLPLLVSKGAIWMCGAQAGSLMVSALLLAIAPRGQAGRPVADRPTGKLSL